MQHMHVYEWRVCVHACVCVCVLVYVCVPVCVCVCTNVCVCILDKEESRMFFSSSQVAA